MDAKDFCKAHSNLEEGEYGTKTAWDGLLAKTLGVKRRTIQNWGADYEGCPEDRRLTLDYAHALKSGNGALSDDSKRRLEL